ncbi:MAG: CPBP family intramembrane glutamic endopeptidase [Myxococcota bacterium]
MQAETKPQIASRHLWLYFGLSCSGSWSLCAVFYLQGVEWGSPASRFLGILYTVCPCVAALIVQGPVRKRPILQPFGLRAGSKIWVWLPLASLLPLGIAMLTLMLSALLPSLEVAWTTEAWVALNSGSVPAEKRTEFLEAIRAMPVHPGVAQSIQAVLVGLTINAALCLFEELGWRGFLYQQPATPRYQFARVGLLWGLWHVPLVLYGHLYPQNPWPGAALIFLATLAQSVILDVLRRSSGSIVPVVVFRGTLMAMMPIIGLASPIPTAPRGLIGGGTDLHTGITGAPGIAATALIGALLVIYVKRQASKSRPASAPSTL